VIRQLSWREFKSKISEHKHSQKLKMKHWTIGKRITVGFASVIIIALVLGGFACLRLVAIRGHSERIAKQSFPGVEVVYRIQKNTMDQVELIYKHIGSSDKEDMARLEAGLVAGSADNSKAYDELDKLITTEQGRALLDKVKTVRAENIRTRDEVLALINLWDIRRGAIQAAILGYSVDRAHEGHGYVTEAVRAVIAYAFGALALHRIETSYHPTNQRSGRVLQRLGFSVEGYARDYLYIDGAWRDAILVGLTNPAWRPD